MMQHSAPMARRTLLEPPVPGRAMLAAEADVLT